MIQPEGVLDQWEEVNWQIEMLRMCATNVHQSGHLLFCTPLSGAVGQLSDNRPGLAHPSQPHFAPKSIYTISNGNNEALTQQYAQAVHLIP